MRNLLLALLLGLLLRYSFELGLAVMLVALFWILTLTSRKRDSFIQNACQENQCAYPDGAYCVWDRDSPPHTQLITTTNQCDGCQRGLPVDKNNNHVGPGGFWSGDAQRCTKDRYTQPQETAPLRETNIPRCTSGCPSCNGAGDFIPLYPDPRISVQLPDSLTPFRVTSAKIL